jgi:dTDP-4-amino-4,6-dideoxygalactose transaminase
MENEYSIPFNKPITTGRELEYVAEAMRYHHISGDGQFTHRCQDILEQVVGSKKALLTTSCTHALEMAAHLLNLQPGDEVILPSYTFVSTANAFVLRGARPRFADIRPDTLNIDESKISSLISPKTRAIVVVHYAGVACEMDAILDIAREHDLAVIEDNAHGLFGAYKDKPLGSLGSLATLSFHETKNIYCGEGGALLVNDPSLIERAEIIREKGTNRSRFLRGEVQKYTWVDIGSSYPPSDLLAAFLFGQLEQRDTIQKNRRRIWESYYDRLHGWAQEQAVQLPHVPPHCKQAFHMFYLVLPSPDDRNRFIDHMAERGVQCVFHYLPLNRSEMGHKLGGKEADCPVSERLSELVVRLPFFTTMQAGEQEQVIDAVLQFSCAAP